MKKQNRNWLWDPISGEVQFFDNKKMRWIKLTSLFRPNCKEEMVEMEKKIWKAIKAYLKNLTP